LKALALATLAICAGCVLKKKPPPEAVVQFELFNGGGRTVTGAVLRFDRELESADHISGHGFDSITLRMTPADTLRLEDGRLYRGQRAHYRVRGVDGPPKLVEGRWIVDGRLDRKLERGEYDED
jgi:hypothetical protein